MGDGMLQITVIIHTRDSEATLPRLLESVRWAEERIVVDMESRDRTCEIARKSGATVVSTPIAPRVDGIRNNFLELGKHEWVCVLDSDEYLAADAEWVVRDLIEQHGQRFDAFSIPRYNMIAGQIARCRGWYPDQQIRPPAGQRVASAALALKDCAPVADGPSLTVAAHPDGI